MRNHPAQWILLPLVVFALCEAGVRATTDRIPWWYAGAAQIAARGPVNVIFIGSSRVAAAVATQPFTEAVALKTGTRMEALNLARGFTSIAEHYLGLRNLIREYPASLHGVTLFIEAPGGLGFGDRWTDGWVNGQYQLLVELLTWRDLRDFWRLSGDSRMMKLRVTGRFMLRRSALVNRRERLNELFLTQLVPAVLTGRRESLHSVRFTGEDLQGPGAASGIRDDAEAVQAARALAQHYGEVWEQSTDSVRDWPGTVLADLQRLIREVDGRIVFFVPPESEVFRRGNRTKLHQEDAVVFADQVRDWDACVLRPAFAYSDDDLPDLWHLRPDRSPEFSKALAVAWLTRCRAVGSTPIEARR